MAEHHIQISRRAQTPPESAERPRQRLALFVGDQWANEHECGAHASSRDARVMNRICLAFTQRDRCKLAQPLDDRIAVGNQWIHPAHLTGSTPYR